MINASLKQLSESLAQKRLSSLELTQDCLSRIDRLNGNLNAFITVDAERSLAMARAADQRIARGEGGRMTGIPVAHKDIFLTKDWLTTCASKMLSNFVAPYDAHLIEQLNAAGAVILGKTNMDEFAMGSSNETSFYGPVRNPWNTDYVPGGSSGGSACAVAARLAPVATASDTGGSIRQPAALTGITGIKPTYGLVSRYGMIAFASSLDQAGAMGRSAEDVAMLLEAMVGFDRRDSTSLERETVSYSKSLDAPFGDQTGKPLSGLCIGVPAEHFGEGLSSDVAESIETALQQFEQLGAKRVAVSLPNAALSVAAYYVIAPAEASSNLSRFDGVRYGYRAEQYGDLLDMYRKSRSQGFGAEVKRRILIGTYVLSHGYYDAYYLKAQKIRRLVADDFAQAFKECDLVLGPTSPTVAFPIGAKSADPVQMYLNDIYTIPANLAGLPGMSIPAGFGKHGLPVGLHMVGNYFSEERMLRAAHHFQQATDWHQRTPEGIV